MNFIQDFLKYNEGNECPQPYVLWTAYGLLSAAIGRRVFIDLDYFVVNCDTYILLVGPSGGRKTASMILGRELILEAIPNVILASDNETYQGIISFLDNEKSTRVFKDHTGKQIAYKPYHIFSEELMDYLQLNPIGMVSFLTNIYGKKFYNYRLKNEDRLLVNPYVTVLACSTPEWLTDQIKGKQFAEGYGRRTVIVCHEGIVRKKPHLSEESKQARARCVLHLRDMQKLSGPMTLTPSAHDLFWKWYTTQQDPADKFLKNWYSTKHLNALKIASLTSLSERQDLVITEDYLHLALNLLSEVEKNLPMVTNRIGRSELVEPRLQLLNLLRHSGGHMPKKDLMARTFQYFRNPLEQLQVYQHLISTSEILEVPSDRIPTLKVKNPTSRIYVVLKEAIKAQG